MIKFNQINQIYSYHRKDNRLMPRRMVGRSIFPRLDHSSSPEKNYKNIDLNCQLQLVKSPTRKLSIAFFK